MAPELQLAVGDVLMCPKNHRFRVTPEDLDNVGSLQRFCTKCGASLVLARGGKPYTVGVDGRLTLSTSPLTGILIGLAVSGVGLALAWETVPVRNLRQKLSTFLRGTTFAFARVSPAVGRHVGEKTPAQVEGRPGFFGDLAQVLRNRWNRFLQSEGVAEAEGTGITGRTVRVDTRRPDHQDFKFR